MASDPSTAAKAGIIRRLGRQAQLRLKLGDQSRQRGDLRHQCGDQRVLLRVREARKVGARKMTRTI